MIRRAPVVIVVSYDGWNYKEAIQGGSIAAGHILLTAEALGLGALPMNSYGADSKIKKILGIPDNQAICCFVLLGFPDNRALKAAMVKRRDFKEVLHWNRFLPKKQIPFTYDPETWALDDLINHQRFYCRKTFLGKEMDIMSTLERDLVRRELAGIKGSALDLLSYDGAYLREFPKEIDLSTMDLCEETAEYTRSAAGFIPRQIDSAVFGREFSQSFISTTMIFKLERIPYQVRKRMYEIATGEFIIISRKKNLLLSLFFAAIKIIFGVDVRRTGIYTFFGPYKPISLSSTLNELKKAGFKDVQWKGYFAFPAFFEQAYQMFLQYRASEGSSYLHREKRTDVISRLINFIIRLQGMRSVGRLGSVVVIRCRR